MNIQRPLSIGNLLLWGSVMLLAACGEAHINRSRENFDSQVESIYLTTFTSHDGVSFLLNGGQCCNTDTSQSNLDQDYVIPMLQRLHQELNVDVMALANPNSPSQADALVAHLPANVSADDVQRLLTEIQKTFPGSILFQAGNQWISIDFLTPEEERLLER